MTSSYSAFFSSGLLAPRFPHDALPKTPSRPKLLEPYPAPFGDSSPTRPLSPLPGLEDMNVDSDPPMTTTTQDIFQTPVEDPLSKRDVTPTQNSVNASLATVPLPPSTASKATSSTTTTNATAVPRLRRRRSSLTAGMSPITAMRSPTRNAGAALHLHRQIGGHRKGASISGPLSEVEKTFSAFGIGTTAAEGAGVAQQRNRLRSGSLGNRTGSVARSGALPMTAGPYTINSRGLRRHVRRVTSVPAPVPPPNSPLPAVPQGAGGRRLPFAVQNHDFAQRTGGKGHLRGGSMSNSLGHKIYEEN